MEQMQEKNIRYQLGELNGSIMQLNKTLRKSEKSNIGLSRLLLAIAVIQLFIAFFQLIAPFFMDVNQAWKGLVVELVTIFAIIYVLKGFDLIPKKEKDDK